MPAELTRLKGLLDRGLAATAALGPLLRLAFGWVHQAAHSRGTEGIAAATARRQLGGLLGAMARHRSAVGELAGAVEHFLKVSRSSWRGLFACYGVADLPRTNNALEQFFGSHRYHERRATGRKMAAPALVLRGAARVVAAVATRQQRFTAGDLAQADRAAWPQLRRSLGERRQRRVERHRFRRDPEAYLRQLEEKLRQSGLPS